ncbi:MAG TPA: hypothetical protein VFX35_01525 [Solirubrobacterales bacterium]|nr:hypothetical protein [Solirubrobacterales bacterium]
MDRAAEIQRNLKRIAGRSLPYVEPFRRDGGELMRAALSAKAPESLPDCNRPHAMVKVDGKLYVLD